MGNSTSLARKIEHAQFTVQDCARQRCKIARWLLCNIAMCRIPCKVLHAVHARYLARNIASCRQALIQKRIL